MYKTAFTCRPCVHLLMVKGIFNHRDLGAVGVAAYERSIDRQMDQLKGREVASHQLETTGKAFALQLEAENKHWKGDGLDLNVRDCQTASLVRRG